MDFRRSWASNFNVSSRVLEWQGFVVEGVGALRGLRGSRVLGYTQSREASIRALVTSP